MCIRLLCVVVLHIMISPDGQARGHRARYLLASGKGSLFLAAVIGDICSGIFIYGGQQVFPDGRGGLHAGHYGLKPASVRMIRAISKRSHCVSCIAWVPSASPMLKRIGGVCATGFALPPGGGRIWGPCFFVSYVLCLGAPALRL